MSRYVERLSGVQSRIIFFQVTYIHESAAVFIPRIEDSQQEVPTSILSEDELGCFGRVLGLNVSDLKQRRRLAICALDFHCADLSDLSHMKCVFARGELRDTRMKGKGDVGLNLVDLLGVGG